LKGSVVPQPYIDKQVKELYKAGVMGRPVLVVTKTKRKMGLMQNQQESMINY
jgi:hypothetical protein